MDHDIDKVTAECVELFKWCVKRSNIPEILAQYELVVVENVYPCCYAKGRFGGDHHVYGSAGTLHTHGLSEHGPDKAIVVWAGNPEYLKILCHEIVHVCLWYQRIGMPPYDSPEYDKADLEIDQLAIKLLEKYRKEKGL